MRWNWLDVIDNPVLVDMLELFVYAGLSCNAGSSITGDGLDPNWPWILV